MLHWCPLRLLPLLLSLLLWILELTMEFPLIMTLIILRVFLLVVQTLWVDQTLTHLLLQLITYKFLLNTHVLMYTFHCRSNKTWEVYSSIILLVIVSVIFFLLAISQPCTVLHWSSTFLHPVSLEASLCLVLYMLHFLSDPQF